MPLLWWKTSTNHKLIIPRAIMQMKLHCSALIIKRPDTKQEIRIYTHNITNIFLRWMMIIIDHLSSVLLYFVFCFVLSFIVLTVLKKRTIDNKVVVWLMEFIQECNSSSSSKTCHMTQRPLFSIILHIFAYIYHIFINVSISVYLIHSL